MKNKIETPVKLLCAVLLTIGLFSPKAFGAATPGGAKLTATINDMSGSSSAKHYAVVWVTTANTNFITTLWKQGNANFSYSIWTQHFPTWTAQRAGSTALPAAPDGYTSATATSYAATDPSPPAAGLASNPINITWNGKDANGVVVEDGSYKFWIEYAEDFGTHGTDTGGLTTGGLTFTKGPASSTVNPANQGTVGGPSGGNNFTSMSIVWTPAATTVAPSITSGAPSGTGTVGVPYGFTCAATGTAPITFTAPGLPTGLTMSSGGVISGTPTAAGTFSGTITAANGTLPNATQGFSITISVVPTKFTSVRPEGNNLVMGGTGPANGIYAVLTATSATAAAGQWTPIATSSISGSGTFSYTNVLDTSVRQRFHRLRIP
jgi:large repetitive protein